MVGCLFLVPLCVDTLGFWPKVIIRMYVFRM